MLQINIVAVGAFFPL